LASSRCCSIQRWLSKKISMQDKNKGDKCS
jgi:hypothetical protein